MTEKERILKNNNGVLPSCEYDIVRVININNPEEELETFKETIIMFLDNSTLYRKDKKWSTLMPEKIVKFTEQLEEDDYHKDDLVSHISSMVSDLQRVKDWEWYSSKLINNGFEVVMKGVFRGIFVPIIHHQGIPHKSIFIKRGDNEYPTNARIDVLTYKTWNPKTLELKRK